MLSSFSSLTQVVARGVAMVADCTALFVMIAMYLTRASPISIWWYAAEGNGVEVGCDYDHVSNMLKSKFGNGGNAVSP